MPAITEDSIDGVIEKIISLAEKDYERVMCSAAAARANGSSNLNSERESELLQKLSESPPGNSITEFLTLRNQETPLSPANLNRLEELVSIIENHTAEKVKCLGELALLRQKTINEVAVELGLSPILSGR